MAYFVRRVSKGWAEEYVKEVKRQKHHLKIQTYESIYHIGRIQLREHYRVMYSCGQTGVFG